MALTKTQTAIVCALAAAAPLVFQWRTDARLAREQLAIDSQLATLDLQAAELEDDLRRTQESLLGVRTDASSASVRLAAARTQLQNISPRPGYRWDDASTLARLPKSMLDQVSVSAAANRRGQLSEQIKDILQLTATEAGQAQAALTRFVDAYRQADAQGMKRVEPSAAELEGHQPEETRVLELPGVGEQLDQFRETLFSQLEPLLGPDRFRLFQNALRGWMPVEDQHNVISGDMAILEFGRRERFVQPKPGARSIEWGFTKLDGSGALRIAIPLDDIPVLYRPHLQDWIDLAHSQPAREAKP